MPYTYADYYNGRSSQPGSQLGGMSDAMLRMILSGNAFGSQQLAGSISEDQLKRIGATRAQLAQRMALGRHRLGNMSGTAGGMTPMQRPPGMMHGGMKPGAVSGMTATYQSIFPQQQQAYGVPHASQQASTGIPSYAAPQQTNTAFLRGRPSGFPRRPQKPLPYIAY